MKKIFVLCLIMITSFIFGMEETFDKKYCYVVQSVFSDLSAESHLVRTNTQGSPSRYQKNSLNLRLAKLKFFALKCNDQELVLKIEETISDNSDALWADRARRKIVDYLEK